MDVANVLTLTNAEEPKNIQADIKGGTAFNADDALFTLLFNSLLSNGTGKQTEATGQLIGDFTGESANSGIEDENTASIMGLNSYLQILQSVFPAGKEANSGLMEAQSIVTVAQSNTIAGAEQKNFFGGQIDPVGSQMSLEEIQLTEEQANVFGKLRDMLNERQLPNGQKPLNVILRSLSDGQDNALFPKALGFEGIKNLSSGEIRSLDPKELDNDIKSLEQQLKALSGRIELGNNQKKNPSVVVGSSNLFSDPTGTDEDMKGNPKTTDDIKIANTQEKGYPLLGISDGKGQPSGQGNLANNPAPEQQTELQPLQAIGNKSDETAGIDRVFDPRLKAPHDSGRAWEQVLDILKKQELNPREVKEITIRLQPAELGNVNVSLRMENGQVHVFMHASEQATGVMIQNHMQELKNGLSQMGVSCGSFEMSDRQSGDNGSGRESSPERNPYGLHAEEEESPFLTRTGFSPANYGSGGRINVSA